jgi:peptide/nickel transport system substrate-binding protein
MKGKYLTIFVTLIVLIGLVFAGCTPSAEEATEAPAVATEAPAEEEAAPTEAPVVEEAAPTEAPTVEAATTEESTLTYIDTTGFYTLDPFQTPWYTTAHSAPYDTLVALLPDGSGWEGILAESWEAADDGLSMTFYLKEGVTFHDGTPWNADAAIWQINHYLDPEDVAYNEDWEPYIESWEKVDDMTIKVNFKQVYATLFADQITMYFVSPTAYEELGADNFGMTPVGTGAWIPIEVVPNDHVLYKRNPDYTWGASYTNGQPAKSDFFKIIYNTDQAVAFAALETGEASFTDLPAQFLNTAEADADLVVNRGISGTLYYLGINYTKEIYQNADFRKALAYAIERDEIILAAFEGEAYKTCQFIPAGTPGYKKETDDYACTQFPYDPEKANEILDGLGWMDSNGDGVRERNGEEMVFPIIYNTEEAIGRAAEVIQGQLADVGISLDLQPMEAAAQAEILVAKTQDFFIRPYGLADPVILSWMVVLPNRNSYETEEATRLQQYADSQLDNDVRLEAVDALNRYLIDTNAWFPIWTTYSYIGYRANVKDLLFDFQGYALIHNAYIE